LRSGPPLSKWRIFLNFVEDDGLIPYSHGPCIYSLLNQMNPVHHIMFHLLKISHLFYLKFCMYFSSLSFMETFEVWRFQIVVFWVLAPCSCNVRSSILLLSSSFKSVNLGIGSFLYANMSLIRTFSFPLSHGILFLTLPVGHITSFLAFCLYHLANSELKIEATCSSETSVEFNRTVRHYIPEERILRHNSASQSLAYNLHIKINSINLWVWTGEWYTKPAGSAFTCNQDTLYRMVKAASCTPPRCSYCASVRQFSKLKCTK
jgi:hypothetical protein